MQQVSKHEISKSLAIELSSSDEEDGHLNWNLSTPKSTRVKGNPPQDFSSFETVPENKGTHRSRTARNIISGTVTDISNQATCSTSHATLDDVASSIHSSKDEEIGPLPVRSDRMLKNNATPGNDRRAQGKKRTASWIENNNFDAAKRVRSNDRQICKFVFHRNQQPSMAYPSSDVATSSGSRHLCSCKEIIGRNSPRQSFLANGSIFESSSNLMQSQIPKFQNMDAVIRRITINKCRGFQDHLPSSNANGRDSLCRCGQGSSASYSADAFQNGANELIPINELNAATSLLPQSTLSSLAVIHNESLRIMNDARLRQEKWKKCCASLRKN